MAGTEGLDHEVALLGDLRREIGEADRAAEVVAVARTGERGNGPPLMQDGLAAEERRELGVPDHELAPWWRVLKTGGFLNPKFPGGTDRQAELLAGEGIRVSPLRRQPAVFDFAERLPADPLELRAG